MAQENCVCCRKLIRRCQGGCRAWVPGHHPLVGASAGVAAATVLVAQTSGVTQATTVSNHLHSCPCAFQCDNQSGVLSLACHAVPYHASGQCLKSCPCLQHAIGHVSKIVVWAFKLLDILLKCLSKKLFNNLNAHNRPLKHDQWHAADMV